MRFRPFALVLACASIGLACSGKSNEPPAVIPPEDTGTSDGIASDTPVDTGPPTCGAEPRVSYKLNTGLLATDGPTAQKGVKVSTSLCPGVVATSNEVGIAELLIQKGAPFVMKLEYKGAATGYDGELVINEDEFRPGFVLIADDVIPIFPGYSGDTGTVHASVEVLESVDGCMDRTGVSFEVVGVPGAKINYFEGYKITKDTQTGADGKAFITGLPPGPVEIKATKTGCSVSTLARGYTGKYKAVAGAVTYMQFWSTGPK